MNTNNLDTYPNAVQKFYQWLCPTVPFEFLKRQSPESFAASITSEGDKKPAWGTGSYSGKLKVQLMPDTDGSYRFSMRRNAMSYFVTEATGTIAPVNRELIQIQGMVVTQLRANQSVLILPLLFAFAIWIMLLSGIIRDLGALIFVALFAAFFVATMVFCLYTWKGMMAVYSDMLVGMLARLSEPDLGQR
ncbi:MAG: hypothetical protein ABI947_04025 [Chloroflexota bacterium]